MKKSKCFKIISSLVVVILIAIGSITFLNREKFEYEKVVDKITEIDYEERQEELNQVVEDGMMNVQYSLSCEFDGKLSTSFNVKNIENNKYPIKFELLDENGKVIYKSNKIERGYELNSIELDEELSKGTHDCQIEIGYAEEGNVASVFPITIEVN
ncbi:MAG: hypothetical protein E7F83_03385 [Clostridium sp.]|uniref:Uncharacterized protein n=1 Tax=Clostridium tertium TaxID=1559 RepID=A0A6N3FPC2_9CLOT|nr:hypothetical protein [Clostridium sp.]MDU3546447.1 hypothetical protein [Clostridium sp.]